jgi:hypothetical protein
MYGLQCHPDIPVLAASGARLGSPPSCKSDTDLEAAGSRRSTDEAVSSGYARRQAREPDIGRSGPNPSERRTSLRTASARLPTSPPIGRAVNRCSGKAGRPVFIAPRGTVIP